MVSKNLPVDLDEVDHELIRLLSANARMTNADLAAETGGNVEGTVELRLAR